MSDDFARDPGPHWEGSPPGQIDLRPTPSVREPTEAEVDIGHRILRVDGDPPPMEEFPGLPDVWPGPTRAARFLELACENGEEYDLSTMPQSYARALVGLIYHRWIPDTNPQ